MLLNFQLVLGLEGCPIPYNILFFKSSQFNIKSAKKHGALLYSVTLHYPHCALVQYYLLSLRIYLLLTFNIISRSSWNNILFARFIVLEQWPYKIVNEQEKKEEKQNISTSIKQSRVDKEQPK